MNGIIIALLSLALTPLVFAQADLVDLQKRIEELESQQAEMVLQMREPKTTVQSFLNDNLTLGGFFEPAFTYISGPDTKSQYLNSSNTLGLNLSAELGTPYRFVSQFITALEIPLDNPHNNPDVSDDLPETREYQDFQSRTVLTQGYVEYSRSRMFNFQGGAGYVPFGHAPQQRELVLFTRRGGPQLIRSEDILFPLWQGFHLSGSRSADNIEMGYNLYTFVPATRVRTTGIGARAWFSAMDEKLTGGLSAQAGKNNQENFELVGADLKAEFFPYLVKTEFAQYIESGADSWTAYLEPGVYIYEEEVLFYIFGDYAFNMVNEKDTSSYDLYQKWEYGGGFNWLPNSLTRLRLGFTYHDYVGPRSQLQGINRDYVAVDISAGVAF
ncbi:MAG: hypothetical protein NDI69_17195 [Bacteriovoracaceae bacterium]|nr:hypothetical protein [Bacteriovoracaceae bacterium]